MSAKFTTNRLLRRYVSGALTAPEEAELERRAANDPAVAAALAGLRDHAAEDHATRVRRMVQGARTQVQGEVKGAVVRPVAPRRFRRWAVVAGLLLVAGALFLLPRLTPPAGDAMAGETSAPTPASAPPDLPRPPASAPAPAAPASAPATATETETEVEELVAEAPAPARPRRSEPAAPRPAAAEVTAPQLADEVSADRADRPGEAAPEAARRVSPVPATRPLERTGSATLGDVTSDRPPRILPGLPTGPRELTGRVTNENGVPIADALVRLPGQPEGELTDSSGFFRVPYDAVATRLDVSHPLYEAETVDLAATRPRLEISLDRKPYRPDYRRSINQLDGRSVIEIGRTPGYAAPREGYGTLRQRLEDDRPAGLATGKYRFSFVVNTDGTLTDFQFRGRPPRAVMDYLGETLVRTSEWEIRQGDEPVRVYLRVKFD